MGWIEVRNKDLLREPHTLAVLRGVAKFRVEQRLVPDDASPSSLSAINDVDSQSSKRRFFVLGLHVDARLTHGFDHTVQ